MGKLILNLIAAVTMVLAPPALAQTAPAKTAAAPVASSGAPAPAAAPAAADVSYRLGSADKVRVIVFNEPTLSGEFTVGDLGTLSLPLIGDVPARGRTTRELTDDITAKLADGYLTQPRVSLDVLTYRPFYILGEVTKPGEYPYSSGLTVMNAVARAEGFTYRANKKKIFIKRAGNPGEERVDLTPNLQVNPGDTIRVGERYF